MCDLSCVHVVSEESEKKVSPVGNIYAMPPNVGTTARKVGQKMMVHELTLKHDGQKLLFKSCIEYQNMAHE